LNVNEMDTMMEKWDLPNCTLFELSRGRFVEQKVHA
jgi:hypothetical protein